MIYDDRMMKNFQMNSQAAHSRTVQAEIHPKRMNIYVQRLCIYFFFAEASLTRELNVQRDFPPSTHSPTQYRAFGARDNNLRISFGKREKSPYKTQLAAFYIVLTLCRFRIIWFFFSTCSIPSYCSTDAPQQIHISVYFSLSQF